MRVVAILVEGVVALGLAGCICSGGPRVGADAASDGQVGPGLDAVPGGDGGGDVCIPGSEVCDGIDNDCDLLVDEGKVCGGPCTPATEVCDGIDNDCDLLVDEGNVCGGTCTPSTEVCDGIDNDCDELADEGGVCDPPPTCGPEVCNGLDDDCDGLVDDGVPSGSPCFSFCGVGINMCVGGSYVCMVLVTPPESCNGTDDDCDGMTDEGSYPCSCGTGTGTCSGGTVTGCASTCVPGAVRWCDDSTYCNWGQQVCDSAGQWGPCTEVPGMAPGGCSTCSGAAGDTYCYDEACCVAAGACCEDFGSGFSPGEGPSTGDCSAQCS